MHNGNKPVTVLLAGPLERGMHCEIQCGINSYCLLGNKTVHHLQKILYSKEDKNKEHFQFLQGKKIGEIEKQVFLQLSRYVVVFCVVIVIELNNLRYYRYPHSTIVFDTTTLPLDTITFLAAIFDETMPQLVHKGDKVSTASAVFVLLSDQPSSSVKQRWPHRLCQRIRTIIDFK